MNTNSRRALAAFTSAASLAAGLLGATASSVQAAPAATAATGVSGGQISLHGGPTGIQVVNADGTGLRSVPNIPNLGYAPNWAPDGSRVTAGNGRAATGRITGATSLVTLLKPAGTRAGGNQDDPVFWMDGRYVLSSVGGQIVYGASDAAWAPEPLMTSSQEPTSVCDVHPAGNVDGTVAFERLDRNCQVSSGIYTVNSNTAAPKRIIASGSAPVYSADGRRLAFTRVVDGWSQLFTANADGTGVQQVTTDASDHANPTWDPAGGRLAYDAHTSHAGAAGDVQTVRILDVASGTSTQLTGAGQGDKPSWQPLRKNTLNRVYGTGPIGIDAAASRWTFDTAGAAHQNGLIAAKSAVLINKGNATYASLAVALGAEKQGPVVSTSSGALDASAASELKRVLPKGGTVYLNGATNLLAAKVATQVEALGYKALRLEAGDLSSLSARVAKQIAATPSWVFIADGREYHDPIAASTAAGGLGYRGTGVVLLSNGTSMSTAATNFLNGLDPDKTGLVTVGATADAALQKMKLSKDWGYWSMTGATHEDVAANLARFWWDTPLSVTVEDTWTWENAVAGGAVTATYGPMLWSTQATLSSQAEKYLTERSASIWSVNAFGGNVSYPPANRTAIGNAIGASSAWMDTVWAVGGVAPKTAAKSLGSAEPAPESAAGPQTGPVTAPGRHLPAKNGQVVK
ncbi:TolB family protein [Streptomyces sp. NPDC088725]|uniref:TolB family protein n=1 Tax=Streptomyces sp. NPDC088725 TaxID=3365873 RepID=UPI00380FDD24